MLNLIILIFFNSNPLVGVHDIGVTTPTYPAMLGNPFLTSSKSGEFLVDTNIYYVKASSVCNPAIAFDGTNYLLVWEDRRQVGNAIYGARIAPDGSVLDPAGILVSDDINQERCYPAVISNGTNYLVVWEARSNGSHSDIYGARVNSNGQVLDKTGILISLPVSYFKELPAVASDGTNYFVVWQNLRKTDTYDIYGTRVDSTGQVLDTTGIKIATAVMTQKYPAVAFDGTNYFVVWSDLNTTTFYDIYGARVSPAGDVLDSSEIVISNVGTNQWFPAIAFDGTNYLVVWQDTRSSYNSKICGARVTPSGNVLDTSGILISDAIGEFPTVAFDSANYLVVWGDSRDSSYDIYGARITPAGDVLDTSGITIYTANDNQEYPAVAFDGTNYLIAWQDYSKKFYSTRVNQSGNILDTAGINITETYSQNIPAIAFDGTNYLAVWEDKRNGLPDIYGARISSSGDVLDSECIPISTANGGQNEPAVAFDGTNYFVVWIDTRDNNHNIYGARVSTTGQVLDTAGIPISNPLPYLEIYPKIAFDGTNYLVVWAIYYGSEIYAARVNQTGQVLDTGGVLISPPPIGERRNPDVAFDGTNYLVVWDEEAEGSNIYGIRLSKTLQVLDTAGIVISTLGAKEYSAIAFDGTNYLVAWNAYGPFDNYAARVSPTGQVLDTAGIPLPPGSKYVGIPSVTFDGIDYVVVWLEARNASDDSFGIYGAKINPAGITTDTFIVSSPQSLGYYRYAPALASGQNKTLIIYSRFTDSINTHPANAMRIWGKLYPFTAVEETDIVETDYNLSIYPNPVIKHMLIKYHLPAKTSVSLKVYDITGRELKSLLNTTQPAGNYTVNLNSKDLSTGIYFVTLNTGAQKITKKLILMK